MRVFRVFFVLTFILLLSTCSLKPKSWWKEPVVAVMADSTDWNALQTTLSGAFERRIRTPQIEKKLVLKYVNSDEFNRYMEFQYLVLAATLESTGDIGQIVERVVSDPSVREQVISGETNIFTLSDQWAKDQLLVILVAKDMDSLKDVIAGSQAFLYGIFDVDFNDRLRGEMFKWSQKEDLEHRLVTTFGWNLRLQRDYFLVQEFPDDGFVWFRRMYPERWIFVRWVDGGDTTLLNPDWVVSERNRIGATYYRGDRVGNRYLFSQRTVFLGRQAQITTGLWENDQPAAGGPFKNWAFYDPYSQRVYMIDVAVHAPEQDKQPFLRRMEIIASTFRTIFDTKEEE